MGSKNSKDSDGKNSKDAFDVDITSDLIINEIKSQPEQDYEVLKLLGEGSYGSVYKVKNKLTGAIRAMKKIKKSHTYTAADEEEIFNEIRILKKMDHPNILKIFEFYSNKESLHIVTEYCGEGELFNEIVQKGPFNERYCAYIMYQILTAINYCHQMKIIHRDLKPENILIDARESGGMIRVKICDFGTSTMFERGAVIRKMVGSAYYIAPEILRKSYNHKCDLWSCGVILYILMTQRPPFNGESDKEIMERVMKGIYDLKSNPWDKASIQVKDLIQKLMNMDIEKRITAEDALKHPWFIHNKSEELFNDISSTEIVERFINNLKNYHVDSVLQETALAYLVHNFPQMEEVTNACKLFSQMDRSNDGKITQDELYGALSKKIKSKSLKADVQAIFKVIDSDNNGSIEYEEFVRAAINKEVFLDERFIRFAFYYFDKDKSGEISYSEIEQIFKESVPKKKNLHESMLKIIKEVDTSGDGKISFSEFAAVMRKLLQKKA